MDKKNEVIILSGMSGSGKTTLANNLVRARRANNKLSVIISADYWFEQGGKYEFDSAKLSQAHSACLKYYIKYMQDGVHFVVVDNTNCNVEEIAPYYAIAQAYGYAVKVLALVCRNNLVDKILSRNIHGVPEYTCKTQNHRQTNMLNNAPIRWYIEKVYVD